MLSSQVVVQAQEYMASHQLAGWLIHSYRGSNPLFSELLGPTSMLTRPSFLYIPSDGSAEILGHHVDAGALEHSGLAPTTYRDRPSMLALLEKVLPTGKNVAMEYSPMGAIPRASRVDAGTMELVRSLGIEVVTSADLLQYATQRWDEVQLASHQRAADALGRIVLEAFEYAGDNLVDPVNEHQVAQFIRERFKEEGLESPDGPIVAVNEHGSDPHYLPLPEGSSPIKRGDWLLIDLWAKETSNASVYADITWVAYAGTQAPQQHQEVFRVVTGARDAALEFLQQSSRDGQSAEGWEVDAVARQYIEKAGYGDYFTHRLGHSLGAEVHGEAVNLDGFETYDTRTILPRIGFTIEPGIYLPQFGMRSEIDVFMYESGPLATTPVQRGIVSMETR